MQDYPSITESEFAEACQALVQSFQENLNGSDWSQVRWTDGQLTIRQTRPIEKAALPSNNDMVSDSHEPEIEELDKEALDRSYETSSTSLEMDFSVVLSPSYQVPVLWFSANSILSTSVDQLDTVYKLIVSPGSREAVRNVGVIGGISIAHHPRSDMPAFFIHPCRTSEVLASMHSGKDINPIQYLMLWFGIVGSAVGLNVPSQVAAALS